jgi:hypothetical protein
LRRRYWLRTPDDSNQPANRPKPRIASVSWNNITYNTSTDNALAIAKAENQKKIRSKKTGLIKILHYKPAKQQEGCIKGTRTHDKEDKCILSFIENGIRTTRKNNLNENTAGVYENSKVFYLEFPK